ncbi:MAG: BadF/BadG/BcrA/BcrD ATPase family protein [Gemmatimonadota bacterium]
MRGVVVGVDGGGTGTRAVALDLEGTELARVEGPPTLLEPGRLEAVAQRVIHLCREVLREAGERNVAVALWTGLAGAGQEALRARLEGILVASGVAGRVGVGTDVEAAFQAAFGAGPGGVLVSGTGSVLLARFREGGKLEQIGGWGRFLGDEGSAYAVGMAGLRAVVRARDGRGGPTALTNVLLQATGVQEESELITWVTSSPKDHVAALAPRVAEVAQGGDGVADAILADAAQRLREHLEVACRRFQNVDGSRADSGGAPDGPTEAHSGSFLELPITFHGGLLRAGRPLRSRAEKALAGLPVRLLPFPVRAELGAAQRALALLPQGR